MRHMPLVSMQNSNLEERKLTITRDLRGVKQSDLSAFNFGTVCDRAADRIERLEKALQAIAAFAPPEKNGTKRASASAARAMELMQQVARAAITENE